MVERQDRNQWIDLDQYAKKKKKKKKKEMKKNLVLFVWSREPIISRARQTYEIPVFLILYIEISQIKNSFVFWG